MKNALILHGAGNNSQGNWFPWLKDSLEGKDYKVWSPDLPDSIKPNQEAWMKVIFSNPGWHFDKDSVIIGHSAGATLALRILEKIPEGVCVSKAVLVAGTVELGTKPEFFDYKRSLVEESFDWNKIKASVRELYFVHSDNDPYECGADQGRIMQKHLGGELIVKPGEGHFNLEKSEGYSQFPLILDLLMEK